MSTLAIDTYKTVNNLIDKGFTREQAEGVIEALTESELVTKSDLKLAMAANRAWMAGMLLAQAALVVALQNLLS